MFIETGIELDHLAAQCGIQRKSMSDEELRAKILATGGPAFGQFQQAGDCSVKTGGMTLRDYFAAKAMASLLSNSDAMDEAVDGCDSDIELMANVADRAYAMADAMLAAREVVK
jgi:hypothetical protein